MWEDDDKSQSLIYNLGQPASWIWSWIGVFLFQPCMQELNELNLESWTAWIWIWIWLARFQPMCPIRIYCTSLHVKAAILDCLTLDPSLVSPVPKALEVVDLLTLTSTFNFQMWYTVSIEQSPQSHSLSVESWWYVSNRHCIDASSIAASALRDELFNSYFFLSGGGMRTCVMA